MFKVPFDIGEDGFTCEGCHKKYDGGDEMDYVWADYDDDTNLTWRCVNCAVKMGWVW